MKSNRTIRDIRNISDFINIIENITAHNSSIRCYRGHASTEWQFIPSIYRNNSIEQEDRILRELFTEIPDEFSNDKITYQKLVRAQHYGLPTRLLDVTLNPLVALYFACNDERDKDGKVASFEFSERKVKFPDSDTISIVCNMSLLNIKEKNVINDHLLHLFFESKISDPPPQEDQKNEYNEAKSSFLNSRPIKRLLHFIKNEKPHFRNSIRPSDLNRYFFIHPSRNNRRIIAQSGAFLASATLVSFNGNNTLKDYFLDGYDNNEIGKVRDFDIIIPAHKKTDIITQLNKLNINNRSLFPDIESISRDIASRLNK